MFVCYRNISINSRRLHQIEVQRDLAKSKTPRADKAFGVFLFQECSADKSIDMPDDFEAGYSRSVLIAVIAMTNECAESEARLFYSLTASFPKTGAAAVSAENPLQCKEKEHGETGSNREGNEP